MRVAVVGSRSITDYQLVSNILDFYEITHIVSGGAKGVDTLAEKYAKKHKLNTTIYRPDYKKYGRSAALVRNKEIVLDSELVIAIWDGISTGTEYTIKLASENNIQCRVHNIA